MTSTAHIRWRPRAAARHLSHKRWWLGLRAAALAGAAGLCVGGCGGIPGDAVARVNGSSITAATLRHWMLIAASSTTGAAAASTALPQPPRYRACIAGLAAREPKPAKGQKPPTDAQLKAQCAQQYTALKDEALSYLISAEWLLQESAALGVRVSDGEVHADFVKVRKESFANSGAFERFLRTSDYSVSDLLLRIKLETLSQRLEQKVLRGGSVSQAAIARYYREHKARFGRQSLAQAKPAIKRELQTTGQERRFQSFKAAYRKRWKERTECRAGYVVSGCRQFKAAKGAAGAPGE
ncbi:MAG TPA: hypothetical protein VGY13_01480 [Solirubrobacteraceae bacterium]|jgi:foldase protein PrsA|nr:hypothetical protein [Solirubrobacteraceae bacterium]